MILDRDWDILLVLDACRYDYFERLNPYKGKLTKFDMGCNGTKKFFELGFSGQDCSDVILINHIILLDKWINTKGFYSVVNVFETHWNNDFGVVLPEDNTLVALEQIKKNPGKRVVIHYAQPHIPFLDRGTNIIKQKTQKQVVYHNGFTDFLMKKMNACKNIFPPMPIWQIERVFGKSAGIGEIYFEEGWNGLKKSYEYNLVRTLKCMKELVELEDKKIVITSDHGKLIGEYHMFSHGHWKFRLVTTVPWFEVSQ